MSNFYLDKIKTDPRFESNMPVKDINLLEPATRAAILGLIAEAKTMGHDLRIMETYRSQARQAHLYDLGYTHLRKVGCHGYGIAADLGLYDTGSYEEDGGKYKFIIPLARKYKLVSGLDWGHGDGRKNTFIDAGHLQFAAVFRQGDLFAGKWYPDAKYDPYEDMKQHGIS